MSARRSKTIPSALLALLLMAGLGRAADPADFSVGGIVFVRPAAWSWVAPDSPLRKAQLSAKSEGVDGVAEVVFFAFGAGQGGGVEANVQRWLGQIDPKPTDPPAERHEERIHGMTITFVSAHGTFAGGMPGGPASPQPGYALRGAILSGPQGDVFVKMTGPEKTVQAAESAFLEMVRGAGPR